MTAQLWSWGKVRVAYKPSKLTLVEAIRLIEELGNSGGDAKEELRRAGECEDIKAEGLITNVVGGIPWPEVSGQVPPHFWRYAVYWENNEILQTPLGLPERLRESGMAREIRVPRIDIEAIWGTPSHVSVDRRFSESNLTKAYRSRVKEWPQGKRHPSEKDDVMWAKTTFGNGVPRDFVRKLRAKYSPPNWRKSGAPSKAQEPRDK